MESFGHTHMSSCQRRVVQFYGEMNEWSPKGFSVEEE